MSSPFHIDPIPTITFPSTPSSLDVPNATLVDPTRDVSYVEIDGTYLRLEPLPLSADLTPALQATIADPAWMLCRQWQFLEFAGEDAGTPIQVRLEGELSPVNRYAPGPLDRTAASRATTYDLARLPLEVEVEREVVWVRHPRLAAEAGLHLGRMLDGAGIGSVRDLVLGAYPLAIGTPLDAGVDTLGREWSQVASGRAVDARRLAKELGALRDASGAITALPDGLAIPEAVRLKALDVFRRWLTWYQDLVSEPDLGDAWDPRRLEYSFTTSTVAAGSEVVLTAKQYADGTLDWHSLVGGSLSLATPRSTPTSVSIPPSLPTPVRFAGAPADRYWEFEDAAVNFGAIDAGPTDLGRLALIEFSLVYGNDWFIIPLEMPVGSLFRATTFTVRDTFGVETVIGPVQPLGTRPWSVFAIPGDLGPRGSLFLTPTLIDTIESAPIEEVALFRDEMANMVWGVERRVQGVSGDSYERTPDEYRRAAQQQVSGPPVDAQLLYRLAGSVPDNWIPFVPVLAENAEPGSSPVVQLERRALVRTEMDGTRHTIQPRGVLLRSDASLPAESETPLRIEEEEVPREGVVVTRSFQFARWFDGRSLLWLGRSKRPGRGEGSSGLRFDTSERG